MNLRLYCILFSCSVFALSSLIYGVKFMKKRNYLAGIEWFALGISGLNVIVFLLTNSHVSYELMHFLDAFSRGFGLPIVAVVGLMEVTRKRKLSVIQDILLVAGAILGGVVLVTADFLAGILPYFYVVMWIWLSGHLVYFIIKLLEIGESLQALSTFVALVTSLAIACIYDFYKIPGDETNLVLNFPFLALLTWGYFSASVYYAYCALERGDLKQSSLARA